MPLFVNPFYVQELQISKQAANKKPTLDKCCSIACGHSETARQRELPLLSSSLLLKAKPSSFLNSRGSHYWQLLFGKSGTN